MGTFDMTGDVFELDLSTFSQGQRKKVDLVRSLLSGADVLIRDEPLNFVDLDSREQIEAAVIADEPTLIFVEHDRRFIEAVATDTIQL